MDTDELICIKDGIKILEKVVEKCFVETPGKRVLPTAGDYIKDGNDRFTNGQKAFLQELVKMFVDEKLSSVCRDIQQLYGRSGALSSNMNNISERVSKLKEDDLRIEGLVIGLRNRTNMLERRTGTIESATVGNLKRISDLEEKHR